MKNSKRIHKVTIKRMIDGSPDTSWLGEYSNRPDSDYSIDRAHSRDCHSLRTNHATIADMLDHAIAYLLPYGDDSLCTCENRSWYGPEHDSACELDGLRYLQTSIEDAENILTQAREDLTECDCGFSGHWNNREYRYFNPTWQNYQGESDANIRKYCEQDYTRMESLNAGDFCFIGIRAEAEVSVTRVFNSPITIQKITSGGLWGIESDSGDSYIESVEHEELSNLRTQLEGIGFSKRAISAAFRDIEHKSE